MGLVNIIFTIIEIILKSRGIYNLELIPYSFYINDRPELGGIFYQPSFNALFLNTTAYLSIFYMYNFKKQKTWNIFYICIYVLSISLSIYTEIRAAMLAVFLSIVLFFTVATFKKYNKVFRRNMVICFSIYILLLILNTLVVEYSPLVRFGTSERYDFSIISRLNIWFAQVLIFLDHPFFGVGLDCFKYVNAPYQLASIKMLTLPFDAIGNFTVGHNEFLQLLCEGGLLLIIPLIYICYKAVIVLLKLVDEKNIFLFLILILFVIHSMFSWELRHPALMFTFVVVISMLLKDAANNNIEECKLKKRFYILPSIFVAIFLIFFVSYSVALTKEFYYINKAKNEKNFFIALTYINKLSLNPYLKYGANHFFVQKSFYLVWNDIFNTQHVPLTKELFKKVNKEKLFYYDKMGLVEVIEGKANYLFKLRPFWFYPYVSGFCEMIKKHYENAHNYFKIAEDLKPNDDAIFGLMHFSNILMAANVKGIDVEFLLPAKKDLETILKELKQQQIK